MGWWLYASFDLAFLSIFTSRFFMDICCNYCTWQKFYQDKRTNLQKFYLYENILLATDFGTVFGTVFGNRNSEHNYKQVTQRIISSNCFYALFPWACICFHNHSSLQILIGFTQSKSRATANKRHDDWCWLE